MLRQFEETKRRPKVLKATNAHLTEEGLFVEIDTETRVEIKPSLMKRIAALIHMAELAKLVGASSAP